MASWAVAQHEAAARYPDDATAALFAEGFDDIETYYIDPVSLPSLAAAGLEALVPSTDDFAVTINGDSVHFVSHGAEISRIAAPAETDPLAWGGVISAGIAAARKAVPALSDQPAEDLNTQVFTGMVHKLDRFTRYAGPDFAQSQRDSRDGFGGIGVTIDQTDPLPRVTEILPGSPAAATGLMPNDHIYEVDGKPLQGLNREDVVALLRGPISSGIDIEALRNGDATPLSFHMVRALIVPPTVKVLAATPGIAWLRIAEFNAETAVALDAALQEAKHQSSTGLHGVVLDLRGDPGGRLDQGADAASLFFDDGDIVTTRGRNPASMQRFPADNHDVIPNLPLVVLVNGGTASAAEVMAAALQDRGRAIVVGSSSYGKGTVQIVLDLRNKAELTLTWARLFTPAGYVLHHHGVVPQICTSRLDRFGDPKSLVLASLHAAPPISARARAGLTDEQWISLRNSCPVVTTDNPADIKIAEKLIDTPALFNQAQAVLRTTVAGKL